MCFFFLLSGFVMEHAYGPRLKAGLSPWKMINIRIIRLYPLYLFAFLMGASVTVYGMWKGWDSTPWENAAVIGAFGLLMLPAPPAVSLALYPYLKPAWSIAFEMLASVIYAVTARFLTNRVLLVIVIGSGVSFASTTFLPARAWGWPGLWYGLSMVIYGFFGGVMIHRLYLAGKLPRWPAWLGGIGLFAALAVPTNDVTEAPYYVFGGVVLAPLFLVCFARTQVRGVFARLCSVLGTLSYGVYVTHVPIRRILELVIAKYHLEYVPSWVFLIVVSVLASLLTVLLDRFYDRPVRRWLIARFIKRSVTANASARTHLGSGVPIRSAGQV